MLAYIEKNIVNHPRAKAILMRLKAKTIIECDNYKEIFNPKFQNFRIQKKRPAVILAEKKGNTVFSSPSGFGIGGETNFYFSHMLNCLYDCRYCFLQGMYSSANYVVFVNYEDFMREIKIKSSQSKERAYFFSGYDCDSLAYEPMTHFVKEFLPFFRTLENATLELRTKSTNVKNLLDEESFPHCVVAFSFTPSSISESIEHKVPSVNKRLQAMRAVADAGWPIGLRFDPMIHCPNFKEQYETLIADIFKVISPPSIHSISTGPLRFPDKMYQKITKLYPEDKLLSQPLYRIGNVFSYQNEIEISMKQTIHSILKQYVSTTILFECHV